MMLVNKVTGGGLRLITKPGIVVDADDISLNGGGLELPEPPAPSVPVLLRIEIAGLPELPHDRGFVRAAPRSPG